MLSSHRMIKSYVQRNRPLSHKQQNTMHSLWCDYGLEFEDLEQLKLPQPLVLDIGVGYGESTLNHAKHHSENKYLAVEVNQRSIYNLIKNIKQQHLNNIKIIRHNVVDILPKLPDHCLSLCFIFFPDPWPKKRHHKRRLINPPFIELLAHKLADHGRLFISTDWNDYAHHIHTICNDNSKLISLDPSPANELPKLRPKWRAVTYYEQRGLKIEHKIWDFNYGKVAS